MHGRAHHTRHLPFEPLKVHNSKFNIHSKVARIEPLSQSYLRKAHFHVVRQCFRTEQSQTTYLLHPDNVPCHPASQHVPFWGSGGALRRPQASHVHTAALHGPVAAFDPQVFGFANQNYKGVVHGLRVWSFVYNTRRVWRVASTRALSF